MNKEKKSSLSDADRKCLHLIDKNYQLSELILGTEPLIYYEFNIRPLSTDTKTEALSQRRMNVLSDSSEKFAGDFY